MATESEETEKPDLPKGFFRSEVIKNRPDPEVQKRSLDDPDDE